MQLHTFTEGTPWYNNLTARSISAAAAAVGRFAPGTAAEKNDGACFPGSEISFRWFQNLKH